METIAESIAAGVLSHDVIHGDIAVTTDGESLVVKVPMID
jgi:hypothetical protein